jgi:hypothetical protein
MFRNNNTFIEMTEVLERAEYSEQLLEFK